MTERNGGQSNNQKGKQIESPHEGSVKQAEERQSPYTQTHVQLGRYNGQTNLILAGIACLDHLPVSPQLRR